MEPESLRARLAVLATVVASLASVATSYASDHGIIDVGRTDSGSLEGYTEWGGSYVSTDGGLTWARTGDGFVPMETQDWVAGPSGGVFIVDVVYAQIVLERGERELSELELRIWPPSMGPDGHTTVFGAAASREVVYSYEYLQSGGNRWMQALEKRDLLHKVIATEPYDLFYDDQSGNLIVAMGLQGVVVVTPNGTSTPVAVGPYSPTDFSFGSKVRTFFSSLPYFESAIAIGIALLLVISFAALAVVGPTESRMPRSFLAFAAALPALLALSVGVYPHASQSPWGDWEGWDVAVQGLAFMLSGFGLFPLLLLTAGLRAARPNRRQLLDVAKTSIGMLLLIMLGALVLFEAGTTIANFVAVGLVGLASLGIWLHRKRTQRKNDARSGADAASMPCPTLPAHAIRPVPRPTPVDTQADCPATARDEFRLCIPASRRRSTPPCGRA